MNLGPHAVVCRFCFHGGAKYPTLSLTSEFISINDIFDEERRIEPGALVSFTMTGYTMNELLFHCCSKLELYIQHLGEPQHLHYILVQDLVNKHVAGYIVNCLVCPTIPMANIEKAKRPLPSLLRFLVI